MQLFQTPTTQPDLETSASRIRNTTDRGKELAMDFAAAIGAPENSGREGEVRNEKDRIITRVSHKLPEGP